MGITLAQPQYFVYMSLRDYFAGQFLTTVVIEGGSLASDIAKNCYAMADAMLAERAKEPQP